MLYQLKFNIAVWLERPFSFSFDTTKFESYVKEKRKKKALKKKKNVNFFFRK